LANIKITIEAEMGDEVLSKLFEAIKLPSPEEVAAAGKPAEIPRIIEVEVSNVGGKLTARLLPASEGKGGQ